MGNAGTEQHVQAQLSEAAARSTTIAVTQSITAALVVVLASELAVALHHRQALLPLCRSLFLAALQLGHRLRRLLLPHQHPVQPLLPRLFRPTSVLADGVEQMGMVRLVRVVLSGDAVRAMDGVATMRMTTADFRGVVSRSSEHVVSKSFTNGVADSVKLLAKCSHGLDKS
jgi:hypothetical protein